MKHLPDKTPHTTAFTASRADTPAPDEIEHLAPTIAAFLQHKYPAAVKGPNSTSPHAALDALFCGDRPPSVSLRAYLLRLLGPESKAETSARCRKTVALGMMLYLARLPAGLVHPGSIHRLVLAGLLVCDKMLNDEGVYETNKDWACMLLCAC